MPSEVVFEGQTFQIARRYDGSARELFDESRRRPEKPDGVRSRTLEVHFRMFQAAIEGATVEIGMENSRNLEWLSREFQFVELRRQVGEFVSQHPHVEVVRLKSAMSDPQRRMGGRGQSGTRGLRVCVERST
jgi:hypothetical protein